MKSTRELNKEKWQQIVKDYELSQKSVAEYSQQIGVNKYTLGYWVKKLNTTQVKGNRGFVKLVNAKRSSGSIFIRYKSGIEIELPSDYNADELAKLIAISSC